MMTGMVMTRNKKLEERLVKEREDAIQNALNADPKAAKAAAAGKGAQAKAPVEKKAAPEKIVKKTPAQIEEEEAEAERQRLAAENAERQRL